MSVLVEIDENSGFCGGVIRAIGRAEKFLDNNRHTKLYSLGAIVHNGEELERLRKKGLVTIGREELQKSGGSDVLIRAHGEPPTTYAEAAASGVRLIDCTCPVVLRLQRDIREAHIRLTANGQRGQIIIFGKVGHAEVLGLVGQADGDAIVVENIDMLHRVIDEGNVKTNVPTEIFSQTTKSPVEYRTVCMELSRLMALSENMNDEDFATSGLLTVHNTICAQVASRHSQIAGFASAHDAIIFVSGKESSNGRVLSELCRSINARTYMVEDAGDLRAGWFNDGDRVGVCGATSTPKWLLKAVAENIQKLL